MRTIQRKALGLYLACSTALAGCDGGAPPPSAPAPSAPSPKAKHVVLIVADTLRANRLGCYGYDRDTSPAIDALGAQGTLYEDCHSQACWTLPSMISLMSGLPVTTKETVLPSSPVLAEILREAGFTTAAFLSNGTVGVDRGFERGFDHFGMPLNEPAPAVADSFADWYASWRASAAADDRFFAWVHFIDPHHPYEPASEDDVFTGVGPGRAELEPRWRAEAGRVAELAPAAPTIDVEEAVRRMEEESNRYDGEVHAVDRGVARIVDLLRESGDLEDTLIVFCADHGEMLYEQENFPFLVREEIRAEGGLPDGVMDLFAEGHRPWYYEDLWHTPLIFRGPGFAAGERRGGLAANLDLAPTILAALGFEAPSFLQGESLLAGREPHRQRVFAYGHRTTAVLDDSGSKLVVHLPKMFLEPPDADAPLQLFDLRRDPGERENLAATDVDRARALLDAIEEWRTANEREVIDTTTERALEEMHKMGYFDEE